LNSERDIIYFVCTINFLKNKSSNTTTEPGKFWFALDNAAKIFPAIITKEVTSVFRLTAVLNQPVKIKHFTKSSFAG
jgi:hypothetical protein